MKTPRSFTVPVAKQHFRDSGWSFEDCPGHPWKVKARHPSRPGEFVWLASGKNRSLRHSEVRVIRRQVRRMELDCPI